MTLKQVSRLAIHTGLVPKGLIPIIRLMHLAADIFKIVSKF